MPLRRTAIGLEALLAPTVQPAVAPLCLTCGRYVDSMAHTEGYPGAQPFAVVVVKHHGAEEKRTFNMASIEWDLADLGSIVRRASWFDPTSLDGAAVGQKAEAVNEYEDEAPRVIHSQAQVPKAPT